MKAAMDAVAVVGAAVNAMNADRVKTMPAEVRLPTMARPSRDWQKPPVRLWPPQKRRPMAIRPRHRQPAMTILHLGKNGHATAMAVSAAPALTVVSVVITTHPLLQKLRQKRLCRQPQTLFRLWQHLR